ncbi:MAG: hypothetical protein NWP83_03380 [Spirosomaceae bacterium]|nr:hypothetical protein [Spirosomataceae bacterium]
MKKILSTGALAILSINLVNAQVYTEKQTRHRFAQMTLGADYQIGFGGETKFLNASNQIENLAFPNTGNPRILIGGTHFWGHADFQISIPVGGSTIESKNQEIVALSGVETSFKYFPWRIEHNKIRPYVGTAITPFFYEQDNKNMEYTDGPAVGRTALPLMAGVTFNNKNHLVEIGATWDYRNKQDYYISRNQVAKITTPPLYAHLSYRFMFDTTIGAETDWESGRTAKVTKKLGDAGKLDGIFLGAGLSSAWWLGESSYNAANRPYIPKYNTVIMPDFTAGYYFHKSDVNVALTYRDYSRFTRVYGTAQSAKRTSFGIEATKYVGDYHGFAPFIGPVLTTERLSFREGETGVLTQDISEGKLAYGVTFGWDIRPNRLQWFLLRTNLRWFPTLEMKVNETEAISFRNIEFNFIQFVFFPNRVWSKK